MDSREAFESTTGPGDMNATRHPAAPLSRRQTTEDLCPRMTAKGRKLTSTRQVSSQLASLDRSATRFIAV